MDRPVTLAVTGDVHLGHSRNEAQFIIKNLNKKISNDKFLSGMDLLVLNGDIFDTLLSLNHEAVPFIKAWIGKLIRLCRKHQVVLRILEGTPSHDRAQNALFESINALIAKHDASPFDMRWVRELEVEKIDSLGISVLYVPDEWRHDTAETLAEARAAIEAAGLEQVDIAAMHGQFRYQLPAVAARDNACHNEDAYEELVKYVVIVNHVHIHNPRGKIIPPGSFDRIAHGEEGPKGFVTCTLYPDGSKEVTFIENEDARRFVTIGCPYEEVEQNLILIDQIVSKLPNGSFVRIKADYANAIITNMDVLRARWPLMIWTAPKVDEAMDEQIVIVETRSEQYVPITIDPNNLKDLVMARLAKQNLDSDVLARCDANLTEMQQL